MDRQSLECVAFGRHLRWWRAQRGYSQEELAERAGLDRTYISSCEAGRRNVTLKTINRLAAALDVHVADLVDEPHDRAAEEPPSYGENS